MRRGWRSGKGHRKPGSSAKSTRCPARKISRDRSGFKTNQTRLILAGFAYVLMTHLRLMALKTTDLAKAAPNTIRQKLLKIGARVIASVRRIKISMPDACPVAEIFFTAWRCLAPP